MSDPTLHEQYQPLPKLDSPLIDENGAPSLPWYRFLIRLWTSIGGSFVPQSKIAFLTATSVATTPVEVYGMGPLGVPTLIGEVPIPDTPAGDQIIFGALEEMRPPEPQRGQDLSLLALLPPPEPQVPPVNSGWLLMVNGDVPPGIICTPDGLPLYVPGPPP